jgi:hypothetical protein
MVRQILITASENLDQRTLDISRLPLCAIIICHCVQMMHDNEIAGTLVVEHYCKVLQNADKIATFSHIDTHHNNIT